VHLSCGSLIHTQLQAEPKKEAAPAKEAAAPAKKAAAPKVNALTKKILSKDMTPKAAEQGFTGKQVEHKDGKTGTADWHNEYGVTALHTKEQNLRADPEKAKEAKKAAAPAKKATAPKVDALTKKILTKDMTPKAAEQGFTGKQVEHKDGKTKTDDWHNEYGVTALHTKTQNLRADPKKAKEAKKAAAPAKKAAAPKIDALTKKVLTKDMTPKAAEQGFTGKQVEHKDGKTGTADWHNEYGDSVSALHVETKHMRADPKKAKKAEKAKKDAAAPAKKGGKKMDLMKPMTPKAAEQGFTGKAVEHKDGKTKTDDWHNEYGHESAPKADKPAPKKAGSERMVPASMLLVAAALFLAQ